MESIVVPVTLVTSLVTGIAFLASSSLCQCDILPLLGVFPVVFVFLTVLNVPFKFRFPTSAMVAWTLFALTLIGGAGIALTQLTGEGSNDALLILDGIGSLLMSGVVGTAAGLAVVFTARYIYSSIEFIVGRTYFRDISIIVSLTRVLERLDEPARSWLVDNDREGIIKDLDWAAACLGRGGIKSGDALTDMWVKQRNEEAAAALRSLKRWIAIPQAETREKLQERVRKDLVAMLAGDWDSLERQESPPLSRGQKLAKILFAIKGLFVGALPFMLLWLIQQSSFAIKDPLANYLTTATIVWALLSYVSVLDPLYSAKLAAIKDISGILPASRTEK